MVATTSADVESSVNDDSHTDENMEQGKRNAKFHFVMAASAMYMVSNHMTLTPSCTHSMSFVCCY
jgi:hypothetical protein